MGENGAPRRYAAFISYRHVPLDRKWAEWLLESLERFRTPRALVRQGHPARISPLYRDEDEVPASADLGHHIEDALGASRALIVVCTPSTPASRWIAREVKFFQDAGKDEHIHVLLADGDPETAFPAALREGEREPIAADVRSRPGTSARKLRRMARLRLAAALLGCTFDDLRRRERERSRRRFAVAGLFLALILGAAGWIGVDYLRRQETVRLEQGAADIDRWLLERGVQSDARLRAAILFNLLADSNRLGAPIPSKVREGLLPAARLQAVSTLQFGVAGPPTRVRAGDAEVLVGTEYGALIRLDRARRPTTLGPPGCPASSSPYPCAVTAIAAQGDAWATGTVGGAVRLGRGGQAGAWRAVAPNRIDQLAWLDAATLLAADGAGRLYRITEAGVTPLPGAPGGAVSAILRRGGDIILVRMRGAVEQLRPDGTTVPIASLQPVLSAGAIIDGRLVLLQTPLHSTDSEYRADDVFDDSLLREAAGRWTTTVIRPGAPAPAGLDIVSPDAAYEALGLPREPRFDRSYRDAIIGLERRTVSDLAGHFLYRIGPEGLIVVDLAGLRSIETRIRSERDLRRALCKAALAPLFTHERVTQRPCQT